MTKEEITELSKKINALELRVLGIQKSFHHGGKLYRKATESFSEIQAEGKPYMLTHRILLEITSIKNNIKNATASWNPSIENPEKLLKFAKTQWDNLNSPIEKLEAMVGEHQAARKKIISNISKNSDDGSRELSKNMFEITNKDIKKIEPIIHRLLGIESKLLDEMNPLKNDTVDHFEDPDIIEFQNIYLHYASNTIVLKDYKSTSLGDSLQKIVFQHLHPMYMAADKFMEGEKSKEGFVKEIKKTETTLNSLDKALQQLYKHLQSDKFDGTNSDGIKNIRLLLKKEEGTSHFSKLNAIGAEVADRIKRSKRSESNFLGLTPGRHANVKILYSMLSELRLSKDPQDFQDKLSYINNFIKNKSFVKNNPTDIPMETLRANPFLKR